MRDVLVIFTVLGTAALLAGCGTATRVVNSNAESASVIFDGEQSTLAKATDLATQECQKNGRMAVLRDIVPVENGRVANFDCRRP